MSQIVTPGERLALVSPLLHPTLVPHKSQTEYTAGTGTHIIDNTIICSSLIGTTQISPPSSPDQLPSLEVIRFSGSRPLIPSVGDTITARVIRINPRLAAVDILCVGTAPVNQKYSGIVRSQDVRSKEIDKVKIQESFRPGDVIKAQVISIGDARSYFLTTAKPELGVVYAKSVADAVLVPISWREMQCPQTKAIELRKVAKTS